MISNAGKNPVVAAYSGKAQGFTLIEILFVLAIVAILVALSIPFYNSYIDKAKRTLAVNTLETTRKVLEDYHLDNQGYPATLDFVTGKDNLGIILLPASLREDFRSTITTVVSYTSAVDGYTLTVRASDAQHSLLVLTPNQVIIQGP